MSRLPAPRPGVRLAPVPDAITVSFDGTPVSGLAGQTLAAVLLAAGRSAWRPAAAQRGPRGVFCGIGVCYDCLVSVNGLRDVRACQREARDGDIVLSQADGHAPSTEEAGPCGPS